MWRGSLALGLVPIWEWTGKTQGSGSGESQDHGHLENLMEGWGASP